MVPAGKKKYQAKSTSLEDEVRGKKSRPRGDGGEEPESKAKKTRSARADDDDDRSDVTRDGRAAAALHLDPGFKNRDLMKQVTAELSRGEVLHYVCRPCQTIAKMQGAVGSAVGGLFVFIGVIILAGFLRGGRNEGFAYLIPVVFILMGLAAAVLAPVAKIRQAKTGWYAITDRRAIVFSPALWGSTGQTETYEPYQLRKMWAKKSFWVSGAGDLVFKSVTTRTTRTDYDSRGRGRTSTSTSTQHFGFLGIEDVKDVERLLYEVLIASRDDDDDE